MHIGQILKIVGVLTMISGVITGYSMWPDKSQYERIKLEAEIADLEALQKN